MATINLDGDETILYGPGFQTTVLSPGLGATDRGILLITDPAAGDMLVYEDGVFQNHTLLEVFDEAVGLAELDARYINVSGENEGTETAANPATNTAGYAATYTLGDPDPNFVHGGIWPEEARMGFTVARKTTSGGGIGGPTVALTAHQETTVPDSDTVALMVTGRGMDDDAVVFGQNIVVLTDAGTTGIKLVGLEIDIQPNAGTSPSLDSIGLALNVFEEEMTNTAAIQLGGVSGGRWGYGLLINGVDEDGVGVTVQGSASEMEWGIHLNNSTYGTAAAQFGAQNDKPALILNQGVAGATTPTLDIKSADGSHSFLRVVGSAVRVQAVDNGFAEVMLYDGDDGGWTLVTHNGELSIGRVDAAGNFLATYLELDASGNVKAASLAGTGSRAVVADANGVLSAP